MKIPLYLLLLLTVSALTGALPQDPLRQKATAGDTGAMVALGDEFFRGVNRPRNLSLAAFWYRKGANSGNPLARYRFGVCLEFGWGIRKSPRLAFEQYRQVLSLGAAQLRLAEMFLKGVSPEGDLPEIAPDKNKAIEIMRSLCKNNYYPSFIRLAELLYNDPEMRQQHGNEIYQLVLRSLDTENPSVHGLTFQAKLLQEGIGVKKDLVFARALLEIAAKRKHAEAEFLFAEALEFGRGTPVNTARAFEYYSKAAKSAYPAALVRMGDYHLEGSFTPHDPAEAIKLFRQAADKKYPPALWKLGWCSENGIGVPKDPSAAFNSYQRSANLGDARGNYHTGRCFLEGIGVKADPAGAFYYFKRSAAGRCREGMKALAECLRTGRGCTKNENLSRRIFREAEKY